MAEVTKTAVLLTVFNRREMTLVSLRTLYAAIDRLGPGYAFDVYLVDDGSTDGTSESVGSEFPAVRLFKGDGGLYWGHGMLMAWEKAVESGVGYDYFLWYNDDSELYPDALQTLFKSMDDNGERCVVTGAFCDHQGCCSYGGGDENNKGLVPDGSYQKVVTMNGNLVLIPYQVYKAVGMIDRGYRHAFGDHDYGYRVQKQGFSVLLTPRYVGVVDNHTEKPYSGIASFKKRWKNLHSPKNSPRYGFRYLRTYKGWNSALRYWISSYLYTFFPSLAPKQN